MSVPNEVDVFISLNGMDLDYEHKNETGEKPIKTHTTLNITQLLMNATQKCTHYENNIIWK